jgi:hypothetical protein
MQFCPTTPAIIDYSITIILFVYFVISPVAGSAI